MSKYVKNLIIKDLQGRLEGINDALLVNVIGLDANRTTTLRKELRGKKIHLMVIKNSLAVRATEGTPLAKAFEGAEGTLAIVWGSEDIVSLAKDVARFAGDAQYEAFEARGGVMDGQKLSPQEALAVSKWPTRTEQLSLLSAQILAPGSTLVAQLSGPGGLLASQLKQIAEKEGGDETN